MKDTLRIGHIITQPQQRDAIHMAIAPVVAGMILTPGAFVSLENGKAMQTNKDGIGVVDPFLKRSVAEGETCWLFLYPGSITGLRHEWYHPAFQAVENLSTADHIQWITHWAQQEDSLGYNEVMFAADDYVKNDEYWSEGGRFEGMGVPDEFWDHYEAIRGEKVPPGKRGSFFSCSC